MAKTKFAGSKEALEQINPTWKDKEILVPLTGSMYVPGIVKQVDSFIIDVGTGYYAEKVCFVWSIFQILILRFVRCMTVSSVPQWIRCL